MVAITTQVAQNGWASGNEMLVNCHCTLTQLKNVRLNVPLANEQLVNKSQIVAQPLAAQNPSHVRSKLERSLNLPFPIHLPAVRFPILPFINGFHKLPTMSKINPDFGNQNGNMALQVDFKQ